MTMQVVGQNGHAMTPLNVVQVEGWPTRKRASEMLCMTITSIRRWEKKGKLHPVCDANGVWRHNPEELEALADELGLGDDDGGERARADAYARVDLSNSIRLLRTVAPVQEQIQQRTLSLLDRAERENERLWTRIRELEAELDKSRKAVQAADDRSWERNTVKSWIESKEQRNAELMGRIVEHAGKFLNGSGTPFLHTLTEQQAAMLWAVRDEFSAAQRDTFLETFKKLGFDPTRWGASNSPAEAHAGGEPVPPGPGAEGATREAPGGAGAEGTSGAQSTKP